jgi:molecular chaperone GrpE
MAMEENNIGGEGAKEPDAQTPASNEAASAPSTQSASDIADRKNAAKAFYRAMYAGGEPEPEDFGMNTKGSAAQYTGPCGNCARLESENKELEKAKNESDNYYKRVVADFENYRRRTDREREDSVALGVQKALEAILPALDDLERAKQMLTQVTDPKAVTESLNLVFGRFAKCMETQGVKTMDVIGTPFDPKFHEPVQEIETNEFPDGVVMQELRRGYIMKDKVIRPSLVNVASNASGVVVPKAAAEASAAAAPEAAPESAPEAASEVAPAPEAPTPAPEVAPAPAPDAVDAAPDTVPAETTESATKSEAQPQSEKVEAAPPKKHDDEPSYDPSATADVPVYNPDMFESLSADKPSGLEANALTSDSDPVFEISDLSAPNSKNAGELAESAAAHKKVVDE